MSIITRAETGRMLTHSELDNNFVVSRDGLNDRYTKSEVEARLEQIIGAAPSHLDTLGEIATQLGNDQSAVAGIITTLAGKADIAYVDGKFNAVTQQAQNAIYAQFVGTLTPTVGVQRYYPRKNIVITDIFANLSEVAGSDVVAKIRVDNTIVQTITIQAAHDSVTLSGLNIPVTVGSFLTADVVSGSGKNLTIRLDY